MQVKKRNGQLEELHYEKINKVLNWAVMDISDVNSSDVAMNAKLQLYDGISTDSIHEVLINSAVELISEENPNYQYVASSLLNYLIRKRLFNSQNDLPSLYELVKKNIKLGFYNSEFLDLYTEEEFNTINGYIKHDRDYLLTYSGLQQVIDKYLVKDRFNNQIFETPQYMWILISMYLFKHYPKDKRLKQVKSFYDDISKLKLNLSTPILSGVRTPMTQFSSCVLVEVGDNLDSIFASVQAVGKYTARKAGIGLHLGNIRSLGDKIRNGEVIHTGVVPFAKVFESTVKSCQQAGLRGGGATTYFPIWHKEIENIVVLKNNRGTDDNRVRKLDYGIQINKLFYNRLIKKQNITLFSPHDVPSLKEAFYSGNNEVFEKIYVELENDPSISKKSIPATELFNSIAKERLETGRIYIMNIDNVNNNGSFNVQTRMSNLCAEITLPTKPIQHIDDPDGEIALCVLSNINLAHIKDFTDLRELCHNTVRALDSIIDIQDYPIQAAKKMLKRRSIGVGMTNLAYFLAKRNLKYGSDESLVLLDELFEHFAYYLTEATVQLAKEFGKCEYFEESKYSKGLLNIDRYNKKVDSLTQNRPLSLDWDSLRKDVLTYGVRNSCTSAFPPNESSSLVSNSTNGIEPIRSLITAKKSKQGVLKVVAPESNKLKNKYELAFDISNSAINKTVAVIQKYTDQAISVNHYYSPKKYENGNIPISVIIKDILEFYNYGGKCLYYANTDNNKNSAENEVNKELEYIISNDDTSCESGACSL